jgi:hypothetical protein
MTDTKVTGIPDRTSTDYADGSEKSVEIPANHAKTRAGT